MQKIVVLISYRWEINLLHYIGRFAPANLLVCLASALILTGCIVGPPPYEEYTLARSAIKAAREAESAQFASGLWNRADDSFRKGERAWKDTEFDKARKLFKLAINYAERAENMTRLKKFQTGGGAP